MLQYTTADVLPAYVFLDDVYSSTRHRLRSHANRVLLRLVAMLTRLAVAIFLCCIAPGSAPNTGSDAEDGDDAR